MYTHSRVIIRKSVLYYHVLRLCVLLKTLAEFSVAEMSGSVGVAQRQAVLNDFRNGRVKVLVCSDQMARGIDVEGVTCIVNYEPPRQYRVYLHRAGRTARAGRGGVVYTLLAKDEVECLGFVFVCYLVEY